MASEKVKLVNDSNFNEVVLKSNIPVLVDFWATWCGPCKTIAPMIDKIAEENEGRVLVCKLDVEESPETASRYGIRGIPTILFFKNGEVTNQVVGAVPKQQLDAMIG